MAIDSERAIAEMKTAFPHTGKFTQSIACFQTPKGREIAVQRRRTDACYVWVQRYDTSIAGITVRNTKTPGMPYSKDQPRSSNLNAKNAPKLMKGNKAWYLEIESLGALKKLIAWYATA